MQIIIKLLTIVLSCYIIKSVRGTSQRRTKMILIDYHTAETIREMSESESVKYLAMIEDDWTHTGAVDGAEFGYKGTVYAE